MPGRQDAQQCKAKRLAARAYNRQSTKSLTEVPYDVSGKRPTKVKVLVVYRTGFVRSGVLSLIAGSMQFGVCGETGEAPLARELFLRHKPDIALVGST
jgi:hypothetical protein